MSSGVRILASIVVFAGATIGVHRRAHAEPAATRDEVLDARFAEGMAHARAGDFESALRSFSEAYAVRPLPRLLFNLALCEEKTGRWLAARKHYKAMIDEATTSESDRADARKHLNIVDANVGRVDITAPGGTGIAVDGGPIVATAPLPEALAVASGHHMISAYLHAGVRSISIDTPAGAAVHVSFAAPPAPAGTPLAPAPAPPPAQPPSRRAGTAGVAPVRIAVSAGIGVAALAAAGAGIFFGLGSQDEADTASGLRAQHAGSSYCYRVSSAYCSQLSNATDAQNRDALASNLLYVAGGVLAAGAIATWVLWPPSAPHRPAGWLVPSFGRGKIALAIEGRF